MLKKFRCYFIFSIVCSLVSAAAIFMMSFSNNDNKECSIGIAIMFWLGILAEQVFFWNANSKRKNIESALRRKGVSLKVKKQIGIFSFFKNKPASCADVVLFASAIFTAFLSVKNEANNLLFFSVLTIAFVSLNLHSFFNGTNFIYITNYKKISREE